MVDVCTIIEEILNRSYHGNILGHMIWTYDNKGKSHSLITYE